MDDVEAVRSGKASLEKLLSEWRDRFELDEDKATRQVLELVLQVRAGVNVWITSCCHEYKRVALVPLGRLVEARAHVLIGQCH